MSMKKWSLPSHYMGAQWPDYYVFLGQNRDSDALTRSNFRTGLARLGGENCSYQNEGVDNEQSNVIVVRESHWACGWVEWIGVHQDYTAGITAANEMLDALEDYPVLSEEDFSALEDEECAETWANCYDASERVEYLRKHSYTASSMADLIAAVRGNWYAAANILHSPSDLIY